MNVFYTLFSWVTMAAIIVLLIVSLVTMKRGYCQTFKSDRNLLSCVVW